MLSKYAGMRTKLLIVAAMVVSGALAGVGGAVETMGVRGASSQALIPVLVLTESLLHSWHVITRLRSYSQLSF